MSVQLFLLILKMPLIQWESTDSLSAAQLQLYLSAFADKLKRCRQYAVEEASNKVFVHGAQSGWKSVEPGQHQRPPSQHVRLHVDHTTPRYLHRKQ